MENEIIIKSISSSSDNMQFMIVKSQLEGSNEDVLTQNNDINHGGFCDNKETRLPHKNVSEKQPDENFRCDVCKVEFDSIGSLRTHVNTLHLNAPSSKPLPKSVPISKVDISFYNRYATPQNEWL